jgi:hypothetical protein
LGQSKRRSFGRRLYTEAWERGWSHAKKKAVLVVGAEWICNIADQHPGAIQIVDIWHAREHLWEMAAKLFPADHPQRKKLDPKADSETGSGSGRDRSCRTGAFPTRKPDLREMLRAEADYFERNRHQMRYPNSHKHGLFLGSAVIAAGCKR